MICSPLDMSDIVIMSTQKTFVCTLHPLKGGEPKRYGSITPLMMLTKLTPMKLNAICFSALSLSMLAFPVQAFNLVFNGDFETITNTSGQPTTVGGQLTYNTLATGWTSTNSNNNAYNFIFGAGTADTTGVTGQYGNLKLWGAVTGSNNGLPASSPTGGNFLAADGAFQEGAISQTISGLTVGRIYAVGFWWAGAQQSGFTGDTTDQWKVTFGGQSQFTSVLNNVSKGFTGWQYQTFNFTANSTSSVLSFFAIGTPSGTPPFSLLDGVTVNEVPEPGMALPGVLLVGGVIGVRLTRKQPKKDA
jgi:hypothetical protein